MTSGPRAASLSPQSCTQLQSAPGVDAALVTELGAVWKQQRLRLIPGSRVHLWGTWCSGITSAPHAEGPGFKSQCVHWRNMSAAAAAAEIQRKLLRPCFALSCFFHCQCHLFCARPFSPPRLASGRRSSRRTSRSSCYRKHACQAAAHSSACFTLLMKTVLLLRGRVTHGARSRHGLRCRSASDSW